MADEMHHSTLPQPPQQNKAMDTRKLRPHIIAPTQKVAPIVRVVYAHVLTHSRSGTMVRLKMDKDNRKPMGYRRPNPQDQLRLRKTLTVGHLTLNPRVYLSLLLVDGRVHRVMLQGVQAMPRGMGILGRTDRCLDLNLNYTA